MVATTAAIERPNKMSKLKIQREEQKQFELSFETEALCQTLSSVFSMSSALVQGLQNSQEEDDYNLKEVRKRTDSGKAQEEIHTDNQDLMEKLEQNEIKAMRQQLEVV